MVGNVSSAAWHFATAGRNTRARQSPTASCNAGQSSRKPGRARAQISYQVGARNEDSHDRDANDGVDQPGQQRWPAVASRTTPSPCTRTYPREACCVYPLGAVRPLIPRSSNRLRQSGPAGACSATALLGPAHLIRAVVVDESHRDLAFGAPIVTSQLKVPPHSSSPVGGPQPTSSADRLVCASEVVQCLPCGVVAAHAVCAWPRRGGR